MKPRCLTGCANQNLEMLLFQTPRIIQTPGISQLVMLAGRFQVLWSKKVNFLSFASPPLKSTNSPLSFDVLSYTEKDAVCEPDKSLVSLHLICSLNLFALKCLLSWQRNHALFGVFCPRKSWLWIISIQSFLLVVCSIFPWNDILFLFYLQSCHRPMDIPVAI